MEHGNYHVIGNPLAVGDFLRDHALKQSQFYYLDTSDHTDDLLARLTPEQRKRLVILDPTDEDNPVALNVLQGDVAFAASALVDTLKDMWGYNDVATPTLDQYIYNTAHALIETKQSFLGMKFMLTHPDYRARVAKKIRDPIVKDFWRDFEQLPEKDKRDTTRSSLNKIGLLLADSRIRNVLCQTKQRFNLKDVSLIARLPIGQMGIGKVKLLGALILSQLYQAGVKNIFVPNCHLFASGTLDLLAATDSNLMVGHQYLAQLRPETQAALLSLNKVIFRVSFRDSVELDDTHDNLLTDLHRLIPYQARHVVDGDVYESFYEPDLPPTDQSAVTQAIAHTRRHYATKREDVEGFVRRFIEKA